MSAVSDDPALPIFSTRRAHWSFNLYPDAAEGGGCYVPKSRKVPEYVSAGFAADPARAAAEAGRRARGRLRRYCAANRLNRLGTLTYRGEGCHDPAIVREHLGLFFRGLRSAMGGDPFPYVWVPEWHKSGHGLHAHFAVGKYIHRSLIEHEWRHGFVHIKLLGDLGVGSGTLTEARVAAGYLSKYVAKTFTDPSTRVLGLHRYDLAQGFQPVPISLTGESSIDVLSQASEFFGGDPSFAWSSKDADDWQGAPAVWAQWNR